MSITTVLMYGRILNILNLMMRKTLTVAGVPPDYFSSDGQLWGMPVYDWENMKKDDNYMVDVQDKKKSGAVRPCQV